MAWGWESPQAVSRTLWVSRASAGTCWALGFRAALTRPDGDLLSGKSLPPADTCTEVWRGRSLGQRGAGRSWNLPVDKLTRASPSKRPADRAGLARRLLDKLRRGSRPQSPPQKTPARTWPPPCPTATAMRPAMPHCHRHAPSQYESVSTNVAKYSQTQSIETPLVQRTGHSIAPCTPAAACAPLCARLCAPR